MPNANNPISQQRYLKLPSGMYSAATAASPASPKLLVLNEGLLADYGLATPWFRSEQGVATLSGSTQGEVPTLAMAYAGHQFANWVPLLGDGRAHMLGQLQTAKGDWLDVQLKGSGQTPYSRGGDGKATLSSALREYLISEAMAGLGIKTTRSLAVLGTGESIMREQAQPGGIVARTAQSHLRVGSFQYAANSLPQDELQVLADFVIEQHFPELLETGSSPYAGLIQAVGARQASLVANWMLVGFIHGVMNTDNASIVGETIDFGPCAFMDEFHPNKVFSSIDRQGRYAWSQQASTAYWNTTRFAESLLPLLAEDKDQAVAIAEQQLKPFEAAFQNVFVNGLQQKLGLAEARPDQQEPLEQFVQDTIGTLTQHSIDFTLFFDRLTAVTMGDNDTGLVELFSDDVAGQTWIKSWRTLHDQSTETATKMRQANPAIIARNHRVEEALEAAAERDDWAPFERLSKALANPYEVKDGDHGLQTPPEPEQRVTQTFCGT